MRSESHRKCRDERIFLQGASLVPKKKRKCVPLSVKSTQGVTDRLYDKPQVSSTNQTLGSVKDRVRDCCLQFGNFQHRVLAVSLGETC